MRKRNVTLLSTLLISLSSFTFAEGRQAQDGDPRQTFLNLQSKPSTAIASRSSPFDPPTKNTFVADSGPGLDTGCTFNDDSAHPLIIDVIIDKAVGPVDGNGNLVDPDKLIALGVIPSRVGVLMPAFDVDVNGSAPPEINQALLNGNILGNLNGDNQIWSLNDFSIAVGLLKFPAPGSATGAVNKVQINIDTLSSGRWCTAIDWVALNLEMKPLVALKLTPANNNPVWKNASTQILHIFEQSIDANCDLILDSSSAKEKPFSAAGGTGNALVAVNTELASCSTGALSSAEVNVNWSIQGSTKKGSTRWTGDSGKVSINVPKEIGAYAVDFDYQVDGHSLPKVTRTLYVTKAGPTVSKPLAFWYQQATKWAQGQSSDNTILQHVLQGIYHYGESNWDYGYKFGAVVKCNWIDLMSDPLSCNYSDCYVFSDVFENMSGLLGVSGLATVRKVGTGSLGGAFITHANASLDTGFSGSAKPIGGTYDRYLFSSHSLRWRKGNFYDATFNGIYSKDDEFIAWNLESKTTDARGTVFISVKGAKVYPYAPVSPNKYEKAWGAFEYIAPQPKPLKKFIMPSQTVAVVVNNAIFEPVDDDGDARFDKLKVTLPIAFAAAGFYNITALLQKNGSSVANRPANNDAREVAQLFNAPFAGTHDIELAFSGQQIFASKENGPYELSVSLVDSAANNVAVTATSPAYQYIDFGEVKAVLTALSEHSVDTDADNLFDILQVDAVMSASIAGQYWLKATLLGGAETIENVLLPVTLEEGINTFSVGFSGVRIYRGEIDGPYEVVVNLSNQDDETLNSLSLQTQGYSYSEFEPLVDLLGNMQSNGVDANNNGLYEHLSVTLPIQARTLGEYLLIGVLTDANGEKSTYFESDIVLLASTNVLPFMFDGSSINQLQMNGPYTLSFSLKEKNSDYISDSIVANETTSAFMFGDFESDIASTALRLTGNTSDVGIDTNNNSLFDWLQVNVGIEVEDTGTYTWSASIVDVNGVEIELAAGSEFLPVGESQLSMSFNGQLIGANGVAGPYFIGNLLVFSDSGANLVVTEMAMTSAYEASQFEGYVAPTTGDFDTDGDVDRDDVSLLIGQLNQAINSTNAAMDLDNDGQITIIDARRLMLLCTRPYCAVG
jgi:hypothetical protein